MKTKLLLFISLVLSILGRSQDNYMALCFGKGMAMGDFAKTEDVFNNGFANGGFAASYSGAYYPFKKLGLAGAIGFNTNYLNIEESKKSLFDLFPEEYFPTDYTDNSELGQWNLVFIHVGPQFSWPTGNLCIDVFLLGGIDLIFSPGMEVNITDNANPENKYYSALSTNNASLGFDGGVALRYQLNDETGIRIYTNYLHSSAKGSLYRENKLGQIKNEEDYKTKIQIQNIGLGLVYRL